jgi:hypothetical protein
MKIHGHLDELKLQEQKGDCTDLAAQTVAGVAPLVR